MDKLSATIRKVGPINSLSLIQNKLNHLFMQTKNREKIGSYILILELISDHSFILIRYF